MIREQDVVEWASRMSVIELNRWLKWLENNRSQGTHSEVQEMICKVLTRVKSANYSS